MYLVINGNIGNMIAFADLIYSLFEFIFSYKYFYENYKCLEELIKITYDPFICHF